MNTAPLAIVGLGCLFPKANAAGHFWGTIKHGIDGIGPVPPTHWSPDDYFDADPKRPDKTYARRGGFLSPVDFNPLEFGIAPRDLEATDTSQLLGLVAAKMALTDANVRFADTATPGPGAVERGRVSVILGVTGTLELVIPLGARLGHPKWKRALAEAGVPAAQAEDVCARIADSYVPWQENSFPGLLGNVVAGRIANKLDLHGTNCVVDAACASSLSAMHLASMELQSGKADVVVTGGVDTFNDIFMYMCFSKTPALSPSGDSKPFDAAGDGTILGEGLGVVVLKRLADAERDQDRIYAVLKGIGTSSDGKGNAIYAPSAAGQVRCLTDAYRVSGVDPATIELIEAHGTGTKVGDGVEATALTDVFGAANRADRPWCALGSVKSQVGHTKAAAGAAGLIKAALALHHKVLPPTLKVTQPVEPLTRPDSPFHVNTEMRPWVARPEHPRRAGVSAFGFGGSNFHAVLEEHTPTKTAPDWDGQIELFAVSGPNPDAIQNALPHLGTPPDWATFARAAEASRQHFDPATACRLVLVAHRDQTNLTTLLDEVRQRLTRGERSFATPTGAFFGTGRAGKLAVLFPGQGSQAVGMGRELTCLFPEMLETLTEAGPDIAAAIYPPTDFTPGAAGRQEAALRATNRAQPALGAVSLGAWRVLSERFGVRADYFAGHSFGELIALAAAGRLTRTEFAQVARQRGELMAEAAQQADGAMLAVFADRPTVEQLASQFAGVTVANHNAPEQVVVSGPVNRIAEAEVAFRAAGVRTARLAVAAAFHSSQVAGAATPFRANLESVSFPPGEQPVFANTTAEVYPTDPQAARDLLGAQLARPVEFVAQVRAILAAGATTILEVGPGSVLTRLVAATAQTYQSSATVFALAPSPDSSGVLDFARTLARLASLGHAVRLTEWERGSSCRPAPVAGKPGMMVSLSGANVVSARPTRPAVVRSQTSVFLDSERRSSVVSSDPTLAAPAGSATDLARQMLATLAAIQDQTAQRHEQFLATQAQAQATIAQLVALQAGLVAQTPSPTGTLPALVAPAPVLVPVPAVPIAPVAAAPAPDVTPTSPPSTLTPPKTTPQAVSAILPTLNGGPANGTGSHAPVTGTDLIAETLLAVVAEKTGYPSDMLSLDMSLDADLGVDSIKRVEILGAIQDRLPDAPTVQPEHLGTLHTLKDIVAFLGQAETKPEKPSAEPTVVRHAPAGAADKSTVPLGVENVEQILREITAEKTGYPVEMIDLNASLDADLGVDSIKRVEILGVIQDRLPDAPTVQPEHLGTLHTLKDIAAFLGQGYSAAPHTLKVNVRAVPPPRTDELIAAGALLTARPAASPPELDASLAALLTPKPVPPAPLPPLAPELVERSILQFVDLDISSRPKRLSVTSSGEFWVVTTGDDPLASELVSQLDAAGYRVAVYPWAEADPASLTGLPVGLILVAPPNCGMLPINKLALKWMQAAGPKLRQVARSSTALLVTIARLDGAFGLGDLDPATDPVSGGLAGLSKTARQEWPALAHKAFDVHAGFALESPAAAAAALIEELFYPGPAEVGIALNHRCTLEMARAPRRRAAGGPLLNQQDVLLVTGGGRGVTAEVAVALAKSTQGTLILTGRTVPAAGPEPETLRDLTAESELKKAIALHLGASATPKTVGEFYTRLLAQREIAATIRRIEQAGGRAAYFPVSAANGRQMADLVHQVKVRFGPMTGLVHGAGVLADRRLEDLTAEQFDQVYAPKVDGLRNILELLAHQDLKLVLLFSSTTARFGRVGQAAYAAANEVLNKTAQVEARRRPNTRVVAINWGPWEGGMVTPALRKVFEQENVGLIPLAEGASFAVKEIAATGGAVEVVALGRPGRSGKSAGSEAIRHPTPLPLGPDPVKTAPPAAPTLTLAFERTVDVASHPVLAAHVLNGYAVLPMALHLEWLAHAAVHANPGLEFHGINGLRIVHGIKVDATGSVQVRAYAGRALKSEAGFVVPVELRGTKRGGKDVLYSQAEVVLMATLPAAPTADPVPTLPAYPHSVPDAYENFLFHGEPLKGLEEVTGVTELTAVAVTRSAPAPAEWMTHPPRSSWLADPLVLDSSFQLMILWSAAQHGSGSLPCFAGQYRQFQRSFPAGPVRVVSRVTRDNGQFVRADVDYLAPDGTVIAQLADYECIIDRNLELAFKRNQLAAAPA